LSPLFQLATHSFRWVSWLIIWTSWSIGVGFMTEFYKFSSFLFGCLHEWKPSS
jgi:hypothetical protein